MNLAELKAKIAARRKETLAPGGLIKQSPAVTETRCTPNQRQLLEKALREGKSSYYHFVVHFEGLLDEKNLISAINKVLKDQLALRTSFYRAAGVWRQRVSPFGGLDIEIDDLSEIPETERSDRALKIAAELSAPPLGVFDGELFRLRLVRISETHHILAAVISHLCCDFASLGILNREVISNYVQIVSPAGFADDEPQAINYLDYGKWLENKFTPEKIKEKKEYWKNYLETSKPQPLGDKPDAVTKDIEKPARHVFLSVPAEGKARMDSLIAEYVYSLQVVSLAVFVLTLFSQTGQNSVIVATPTSGREKPELENLIGCFANLLVFHIEIDSEKTFFEFLEEVRSNLLECYRHQDTPFDFIEEAAPAIFKSGGGSLTDTIFSVNEIGQNRFEVPGIKIRLEMLDTFQAAADLTFIVYSDRELLISAEYRTTVFSPDAIKKLQTDYLHLLMLFTKNPEAKIGRALNG
jgi:hypothetical protein